MHDPLTHALETIALAECGRADAPRGRLIGQPDWAATTAGALATIDWIQPTADDEPVDVCIIDVRGDQPLDPQRLAYWRDLGTHQLLVITDADDAAMRRELLSLALSPIADAGTAMIWGHHIANYKRTPDWLNPRFWANPERWDVERW